MYSGSFTYCLMEEVADYGFAIILAVVILIVFIVALIRSMDNCVG